MNEEGFKVGVWDIETTHLQADFGFVLAACVKEIGKKPEIFRIDELSVNDERWNDSALVMDVAAKVNSLDMVVTWNGKRFDWPFLQTRLLHHGLELLEPTLHVDAMYLSRYRLRLHSNSQKSVMKFMEVKNGKTDLDPMVWVKAAHGDKESMDFVVDHCVRDVKALEELFLRLKPFIRMVRKSG